MLALKLFENCNQLNIVQHCATLCNIGFDNLITYECCWALTTGDFRKARNE